MNDRSSPVLLDTHGRQITTLRVSITDKCNFRCTYCMPEAGVALKLHLEILRYEQITAIVQEAARLGIFKVKITGGEPLVRKDIESLIRQLAIIPGITDLGMTTNGSLLTPEKARVLRDAGLMRINISLDSLDPARFAAITRGADIVPILRGIDAAIDAGLSPVKINMVIMEETTHADIDAMKRFCAAKNIQMQTIAHFSLERREAHRPMTTDRPPPCHMCNRLRLTADGFLKPCLFSDREIKVDLNDIRGSLLSAIDSKPLNGYSCSNRHMSQIGG